MKTSQNNTRLLLLLVSYVISLSLAGCQSESSSSIADSSNQSGSVMKYSQNENDSEPIRPNESAYIFVYRHHFSQMANLPDRGHDHDLVMEMLDNSDITYFSHGSLGRDGDQIEIARRDLEKWTKLVTELIDGGQLKYYTSFGLDELGLGFVDLTD